MHHRALTDTVWYDMFFLMGGTKVPIGLHVRIAFRVDDAGADAVYRGVASAVERGGHPGIESFVNELAPWLRVAKVDNKTSSCALNVHLHNAVEDAINKEIGSAVYYEMSSDLSDEVYLTLNDER